VVYTDAPATDSKHACTSPAVVLSNTATCNHHRHEREWVEGGERESEKERMRERQSKGERERAKERERKRARARARERES
jgi:hypothetical protein